MPFAEFLEAINPIKGWLEYYQNRRDAVRAEEKAALRALYVAANETRLYFRRIAHGNFANAKKNTQPERDINKEDELSRLWMEAAIELREVAPDLAERCFEKGGYWADRDAWTKQDVIRANIRLDDIFKDAQNLLRS